ncbi:MAG TPA: bifunctional precorrin-2 dehydrogenase/sirohydrochlorin ferrochelatase [Polyangiales bacterium]|nr:bifunctional precorrin-2 dehydrogenase/sirohydrochlorin ferrochelatase [Polyangiales bacterium]
MQFDQSKRASVHADVFPVALALRGRSVLVLGGSEEAVAKVPKLLEAGARVTLVAPAVDPGLARLARSRVLDWYARDFLDHDVQGAHLVMLTDQDPGLARRLRGLGGKFWLCAIDQPEFSDVYLVSTVRSGPLMVSISSGGSAPLLARRIRESLERAFDSRFGEFARKFAALRASVREMPRPERTARLARALDGFAMDVHVRYPAQDGLGAEDPSTDVRERDAKPTSRD